MTPAEELRAAAKKIRAICAGVQATPWTEDNNDMSWQLRGGVVGEFQLIKAPKKGSTQAEYWPNAAERQHILLWQPDTALLVANWLENVAEIEKHGFRPATSAALAVARAINGEPEASATQPMPAVTVAVLDEPRTNWLLYERCACGAAPGQPCVQKRQERTRPHVNRSMLPQPPAPLVEVPAPVKKLTAENEPTVHRYVSVSLWADGWLGKCSCGIVGFGHDSKEEAHESLMAHLGADHEAGA
ncbi:hypothetical protein Cme02nite_38700 [Catellatospora methionotrophica]|uniref:Uncharacterized protein n=1 Tax=Catellatospora methionotrophica TaxID=121620 RepID=A0A8J3LCB8_9ACTN|nr:hypothetical protein [Catellatospora methionotrophica]GIG15538.1 hypothetical protein Cme02nite_38700 [Catellatospora methionotrophica]